MFIGPTVGVIEQSAPGSDTCLVTIGGEPDWVARYLAGLPVDFEVLEPPEVRDELHALDRTQIYGSFYIADLPPDGRPPP